MILAGQRVQPERYQIIPRTLVFVLRGEEILLIRIAEDRGAWGGLYNGIGGHIESGESPHEAAMREVKDETGLTPNNLRLCGMTIINTGSSPGIGIHVFVGTTEETELLSNHEGQLEWLPMDRLNEYPMVHDLPMILPRALQAFHQAETFTGITSFDASGQPQIIFNP